MQLHYNKGLFQNCLSDTGVKSKPDITLPSLSYVVHACLYLVCFQYSINNCKIEENNQHVSCKKCTVLYCVCMCASLHAHWVCCNSMCCPPYWMDTKLYPTPCEGVMHCYSLHEFTNCCAHTLYSLLEWHLEA